MNICILSNFTRELDGEVANRFSYLAYILAERGHEVKLITTNFYHATKKQRPEPKREKYRFEIVLCHEPGYKKNISIRRLYSHYIWGKNVAKYLMGMKFPDIVYCAVPSLTVGVRASYLCKKNGAKFVVDVQDLWPEAFFMVIKNTIFQKVFLPLKWYANIVYRAADLVVAVSDTYVHRALAVNHNLQNGLSVYLGNDRALFDTFMQKSKKHHDKSKLKLCYIGTLSYSYDINMVINALDLAKDYLVTPIKFIVIGAGPLRSKYESYAKSKGVEYEFTGRLKYQQMVEVLCSCDIVINPIVKGSAASIINKVGDYAFSGLPVINTQESPEYRELIDKYHCGINCECENVEQVANAIIKLTLNKNLRKEMGISSRKLAEEKFDRSFTYKKIISALESLYV